MSTGSFDNWLGNVSEIGALYPFEGTEFILWIIGMAIWILWHVRQSRIEANEYADELKRYGSAEALRKRVAREDPEHP